MEPYNSQGGYSDFLESSHSDVEALQQALYTSLISLSITDQCSRTPTFYLDLQKVAVPQTHL